MKKKLKACKSCRYFDHAITPKSCLTCDCDTDHWRKKLLTGRQVLNRIEKLYQAGEEDWTIMDAIKQLRREC